MVQIALNEQRMLPSLRAAGGLQRVIHLRPHHGAGLGLALCCGNWREKTKGSNKIPEVSPVSPRIQGTSSIGCSWYRSGGPSGLSGSMK